MKKKVKYDIADFHWKYNTGKRGAELMWNNVLTVATVSENGDIMVLFPYDLWHSEEVDHLLEQLRIAQIYSWSLTSGWVLDGEWQTILQAVNKIRRNVIPKGLVATDNIGKVTFLRAHDKLVLRFDVNMNIAEGTYRLPERVAVKFAHKVTYFKGKLISYRGLKYHVSRFAEKYRKENQLNGQRKRH